MNVWVLTDHYDEVRVFSEDTDLTEVPYIKQELSYLTEAYEEERERFLSDIKRAKRRGYGSAALEERFRLELVEVE